MRVMSRRCETGKKQNVRCESFYRREKIVSIYNDATPPIYALRCALILALFLFAR